MAEDPLVFWYGAGPPVGPLGILGKVRLLGGILGLAVTGSYRADVDVPSGSEPDLARLDAECGRAPA